MSTAHDAIKRATVSADYVRHDIAANSWRSQAGNAWVKITAAAQGRHSENFCFH